MLRFGILLIALACMASAARVGFKSGSDESVGSSSSSEKKPSNPQAGLGNPDKEDPSEEGSSEEIKYKNTTCQCGVINKVRQRIINGVETSEGKYPFMVSIRNFAGLHFCGGSIITPIHILTAAHCVSRSDEKTKPNATDLIVVAGAHHIMDDSSHGQTQRMKVKQVVIPNKWFQVKKSLANDVAVLVLKAPLRFSRYVSPVCLTPEEPQLTNRFIKAMGWGLTETSKLPDRLLEADVQVIDKSNCKNNSKEVCFRTGKSASCRGDSGGPYVYVDPKTNRYTQVGLVSYGKKGCGGKTFVGTNVPQWYAWIESAVKVTSKEYGICRRVD